MSHIHSHGCCDHCLHFCAGCNITYCCKCKEEWGKYQRWYTYPQTWTTYCGSTNNDLEKYNITFTTSGDTTTSCTHCHGEEVTKKK